MKKQCKGTDFFWNKQNNPLFFYLFPDKSLALLRFAVDTGIYSAVWYACYLSCIANGIEICYKFATKRHLNYREIQS